jgi:hypothetical protein
MLLESPSGLTELELEVDDALFAPPLLAPPVVEELEPLTA